MKIRLAVLFVFLLYSPVVLVAVAHAMHDTTNCVKIGSSCSVELLFGVNNIAVLLEDSFVPFNPGLEQQGGSAARS